MIGQSQSGTGKTAAFVLAMLIRLNIGLNVPQVNAKKLCKIKHGLMFSI